MGIVRTGAADKFNELVAEFGHNPISIINEAGLCSAQFRDPNTYIACSKLAELLEIAALRCQQPSFGIQLAQWQSLSALGDLPMLVARAQTVGEALTHINDYLYLQSSAASIHLSRRGERICIALELDVESKRGITQLLQMSVAQMAKFVASILNIEVQLIALHLQQRFLVSHSKSQASNLPDICVGESFNGIWLKANLLSSKNHQDQHALDRHFQEHFQYLQNRYPNDLAAQTSDMIGRLLPSGECSIERVAKALNLHPRVLQLRLKDDSTSYRQILQHVRQTLAEHYLQSERYSITDIALQLGYAEIAVFSRHFKTWTGLSPSQWRSQFHSSA